MGSKHATLAGSLHDSMMHRSKGTLALVAAMAAMSLWSARPAQAAPATWNATPTDGNWVASGGENNWSTGVNTYPGSTSVLTNTDTATFNNVSSTTAVTINNSKLNVKSLLFDGGASAYTIGSTGGNPLLLTNGGSIALGTTATSFTGTNTAETINAPLVLEPASATTAGSYTLTNLSTTASNTLNFGGAISGGTTTSAITLVLGGANTGTNTISGAISNGSASSLTLNTGSASSGGNPATWILSGNNSYTGLTNITGTGTLVLSGDNSAASGGVSVSNGTLDMNSAKALGTGTLTLANGHSTLDNTSGSAITVTTNNAIAPGSFIFTGTHNLNLGTGTVTIGSTHITIQTNANTLTMGGAMPGTASTYFIKAGAGTLALTGNLSMGGGNSVGTNTNTNAGTLLLSGDNSAATGGFTVFNGTLDINSPTALGTGKLTLNNGSNPVIDNTSGSAITLTTVTPQAWAGPFTFTGSNDLNLGTGAVTLSNSPTVTVTAGTLTVGGAIGGSAGTLTKAGAGKLVLAATNTYTGPTTISDGTLKVTGSLPSGSAVTVGSATGGLAPTLAGTGTVNGAITANGPGTGGSAGHIAPNDQNAIGTLTAAAAVNLKDGAILDWDLGTAGSSHAAPGVGDLIAMTGTANNSLVFPTGGGTVTLNLTSGAANLNSGSGSYELFSYANAAIPASFVSNFTGGTITGDGTVGSFNLVGLPAGNTYTLSNDTTHKGIFLDYVAVPEPASLSLLVLSSAALLGTRRRRRT